MTSFISIIKTKTTAAENRAHRYREQMGGGQMLGVGWEKGVNGVERHKLPVIKIIESRG